MGYGLRKRAFTAMDARNTGTAGVRRPPAPAKSSITPMMNQVNRLNRPGGSMSPGFNKLSAAIKRAKKEPLSANDVARYTGAGALGVVGAGAGGLAGIGTGAGVRAIREGVEVADSGTRAPSGLRQMTYTRHGSPISAGSDVMKRITRAGSRGGAVGAAVGTAALATPMALYARAKRRERLAKHAGEWSKEHAESLAALLGGGTLAGGALGGHVGGRIGARRAAKRTGTRVFDAITGGLEVVPERGSKMSKDSLRAAAKQIKKSRGRGIAGGIAVGSTAVGVPLFAHLAPKIREAYPKTKHAEAAATNDNVSLPRITPDPAEAHASHMAIGNADFGDPDSVPVDNRKEDQTLSPASEERAQENMEGYLRRYFSMAKTPATRNMPHTDLSAVIRHEMTREQARAHMEAEGLKKTAALVPPKKVLIPRKVRYRKGVAGSGGWVPPHQRGKIDKVIDPKELARSGHWPPQVKKASSRLDFEFPHVSAQLSRTFSR